MVIKVMKHVVLPELPRELDFETLLAYTYRFSGPFKANFTLPQEIQALIIQGLLG